MKQIREHQQISDTIKALGQKIRALQLPQPVIVGIHTGGVILAEQICQHFPELSPHQSIDISFYRDDFSRVGFNPEVKGTNLNIDIENKNIILIDDILHTGRTIRAAMNEIFAYGRPKSITLAVLATRNGRELPIQADIVGYELNIAASEHVKLSYQHNQFSLQLFDH